jgi:hypothetical protein
VTESTSTTTVAPPSPNGTGMWTQVEAGISVTLRMDPVLPQAGETVHFYVTATDQTQWCCLTTFISGDGTTIPFTIGANPCPQTVPRGT